MAASSASSSGSVGAEAGEGMGTGAGARTGAGTGAGAGVGAGAAGPDRHGALPFLGGGGGVGARDFGEGGAAFAKGAVGMGLVVQAQAMAQVPYSC